MMDKGHLEYLAHWASLGALTFIERAAAQLERAAIRLRDRELYWTWALVARQAEKWAIGDPGYAAVCARIAACHARIRKLHFTAADFDEAAAVLEHIDKLTA